MNHEERIKVLERRHTRLIRRIATACVVILTTSLVAATQYASLVAQRLEVKDESGTTRATLDSNGNVSIDGTLKIQGVDVAREIGRFKGLEDRIAALEATRPAPGRDLKVATFEMVFGTAGVGKGTPVPAGVPTEIVTDQTFGGEVVAVWHTFTNCVNETTSFIRFNPTPLGNRVKITASSTDRKILIAARFFVVYR